MSKLNENIKECSEKGYEVLENGEVKGKIKILSLRIDKKGYKSFTFRNKNGAREVVLVHRLQAYQKYGEKIFEKGIVARHLDGNSLNNSWNNIGIGTPSDNQMDRNESCRKNSATIASRKMQNNIRSYEERCLIYEDLKNGISYSEIMNKHNISSKGTLSFMKNKSEEYKEYIK